MDAEELRDLAKVFLRISSDVYDTEIDQLVEAAIADMKRVGIKETYINEGGALVKQAIMVYCKAHFGYDNEESAQLEASYRQTVIDLMNLCEANEYYDKETTNGTV